MVVSQPSTLCQPHKQMTDANYTPQLSLGLTEARTCTLRLNFSMASSKANASHLNVHCCIYC